MIVIDTLLTRGLRFILNSVAQAVDSELDEEPLLREELLATQMQLEVGEIDEAEFQRREKDILAGLRRVREAKTGGTTQGHVEVAGVETTFEPVQPLRQAKAPRRRAR